MPAQTPHTQRSVEAELMRRIQRGEWLPGTQIPKELDLADEFSCSRTTVSRALQTLAHDGLVVRKRRSGTRVAIAPDRKATLEIPIVRKEVESRGGVYGHLILKSEQTTPPLWVQVRFGQKSAQPMLHLHTLHLCDSHPHMFEDRWVSLEATPSILSAPLDEISPNEWLVSEVPFSRGDIAFSACAANAVVSEAMETDEGTAMLLVERTTWIDQVPITTVRMHYASSYRLTAEL